MSSFLFLLEFFSEQKAARRPLLCVDTIICVQRTLKVIDTGSIIK